MAESESLKEIIRGKREDSQGGKRQPLVFSISLRAHLPSCAHVCLKGTQMYYTSLCSLSVTTPTPPVRIRYPWMTPAARFPSLHGCVCVTHPVSSSLSLFFFYNFFLYIIAQGVCCHAHS